MKRTIKRYMMSCKDCNHTFWALENQKGDLPDECHYCKTSNKSKPNIESQVVDFIHCDENTYLLDIDPVSGIPFVFNNTQ